MPNICDINDKGVRSYKTLANLEAALQKLGFSDHRYIVAYTATGRATAIFQWDRSEGGYVFLYSQYGFITV